MYDPCKRRSSHDPLRLMRDDDSDASGAVARARSPRSRSPRQADGDDVSLLYMKLERMTLHHLSLIGHAHFAQDNHIIDEDGHEEPSDAESSLSLDCHAVRHHLFFGFKFPICDSTTSKSYTSI